MVPNAATACVPQGIGAWRSPVSALVWETRGRRFKSFRSDHKPQIIQHNQEATDYVDAFETRAYTRASTGLRVNMPTLKRNRNGSYGARARVPADISGDYGRLHGQRLEAKFYAPAGTSPSDAQRLFGEWLAEHLARVANLRAIRQGGALTLTFKQANILAGQWYLWFVGKHEANPGAPEHWEGKLDDIQEALNAFRNPSGWHDDLGWSQKARDSVLPLIADAAETATFLASKGIELTAASKAVWMDRLFDHHAAALHRLEQCALGNYGAIDNHAASLPSPESVSTDLTPWQLFQAWILANEPAPSTVENWRYMFVNLEAAFPQRSATSLTEEEAQAWLTKLVNPERSARTVNKTWARAVKAIYEWARKPAQKLVHRNPFADVEVTEPRHISIKRRKTFNTAETRIILKAALAVSDTSKPLGASIRWIPWLLAYTGARAGEIAQLRGIDVVDREGVNVLRLTPEAGTIKSGEAREVPLHEHLIEQGFVEWARMKGKGPLFYNPRPDEKGTDPTMRKKAPAVQARQRVGHWVRSLGVTEPLQPNHAWRHTFKMLGRREGIGDKHLDDICGHAAGSEGKAYGPSEIFDMSAALAKYPRYRID